MFLRSNSKELVFNQAVFFKRSFLSGLLGLGGF
ncbi:hypothetical protein N206_01380 [Helicobacter pylori UM111]|nr:hypothetical protein N206_01380 [Helicobacter pylori UM111]